MNISMCKAMRTYWLLQIEKLSSLYATGTACEETARAERIERLKFLVKELDKRMEMYDNTSIK